MQLTKPIDLATIQKYFTLSGVYAGEVDGVWDLETGLATNAFLLLKNVPKASYSKWGKEQKLVAVQQLMCRDKGINPGDIDGLVGPQTQWAVNAWWSLLTGTPEGVLTWRDWVDDKPAKQASDLWPTRSQLNTFYGPVGSGQIACKLPFPLRIAWDLRKTVSSIQCHRKVAGPTARALARVLEHYGIEKVKALRLDLWGGSLNVRKVRGGSAMSIHSWGAAHDFDPERNALKMKADQATFDNAEYKVWWEIWELEGAVSQGRALGFDWMHVQFAKY